MNTVFWPVNHRWKWYHCNNWWKGAIVCEKGLWIWFIWVVWCFQAVRIQGRVVSASKRTWETRSVNHCVKQVQVGRWLGGHDKSQLFLSVSVTKVLGSWDLSEPVVLYFLRKWRHLVVKPQQTTFREYCRTQFYLNFFLHLLGLTSFLWLCCLLQTLLLLCLSKHSVFKVAV